MITMETKRFGRLELDEREVITFAEGLAGFPESRRFCLIDHEGSPFKWLQCVDDPERAFLVTDPRWFAPDYNLILDRREVRGLGLRRPEEATVLVILTVAPEPSQLTANLRGPLVVNHRTRRGRQVVLLNNRYPTRYRVIEALRRHWFKEARPARMA